MEPKTLAASALVAAALAGTPASAQTDDAATIAALDTAYQLAVEKNDWQGMDRILHPDMVLVLGNGTSVDRTHLIKIAREKKYEFEKQVEMPGTQKVRMFGKDTGVVTALLWIKGKKMDDNSPLDFKLWFTDTYVRTPTGWKYAFGQASSPLPPEAKK